MIEMAEIKKDEDKIKSGDKSRFATVSGVSATGLKIHIDGENVPRGTFYKSLCTANVGDRVYIDYISGTILIIGKLMY